MSQVTIGRITTGHVINLASNDVHRLESVSIITSMDQQNCMVQYAMHSCHTTQATLSAAASELGLARCYNLIKEIVIVWLVTQLTRPLCVNVM